MFGSSVIFEVGDQNIDKIRYLIKYIRYLVKKNVFNSSNNKHFESIFRRRIFLNIIVQQYISNNIYYYIIYISKNKNLLNYWGSSNITSVGYAEIKIKHAT